MRLRCEYFRKAPLHVHSQPRRVPARPFAAAHAHALTGHCAPQSHTVDPKTERLFRKYLTILPALLRYLAPHPRVMDLSGPTFDFATGRSTSERRCICRSIFDIATNTSKLPESLQDPVLSSLMQLLIGFPAECNDFSAQVRNAHWSRSSRPVFSLRYAVVYRLPDIACASLCTVKCNHMPATHGPRTHASTMLMLGPVLKQFAAQA